jgi:hypothetical protein
VAVCRALGHPTDGRKAVHSWQRNWMRPGKRYRVALTVMMP